MIGFDKVMRYCDDLLTYEQAKASGSVTDDVFVIILSERIAKFKGATFDWSSGAIIKRIVTSDAEGKVVVDDIEGYSFLCATSFNNGFPLNVIRFGDYFYVGYYGGQSEPNTTDAIQLYFTCKASQEVNLFYIKDTE